MRRPEDGMCEIKISEVIEYWWEKVKTLEEAEIGGDLWDKESRICEAVVINVSVELI